MGLAYHTLRLRPEEAGHHRRLAGLRTDPGRSGAAEGARDRREEGGAIFADEAARDGSGGGSTAAELAEAVVAVAQGGQRPWAGRACQRRGHAEAAAAA